jgi:hypothetical protein
VRASTCLAAVVVLLSGGGSLAGAAAARDCATEANVLSKDQSELPKLDVTSPQDRPPYCITLETIMAFAGRVKAHVAHCPGSDFAAAAADWAKTQTDYSKRFSQRRCKRTL